MANTKSHRPKLTVSFSYGFVEGNLQSRKFTKALETAGYSVVKDPLKANITIAHSAGCWEELKSNRPKIVFYIGMPLIDKKPLRTWLKANSIAIKILIKRRRFSKLIKSILANIFYLLRHPFKNWQIIQRSKRATSTKLQGVLTVFIANKHDPWPRSTLLQEIVDNEKWSFISLPGSHNNLWHQPNQYIKLMDHYVRLLEKTDK